jgi:hypothetical protein
MYTHDIRSVFFCWFLFCFPSVSSLLQYGCSRASVRDGKYSDGVSAEHSMRRPVTCVWLASVAWLFLPNHTRMISKIRPCL